MYLDPSVIYTREEKDELALRCGGSCSKVRKLQPCKYDLTQTTVCLALGTEMSPLQRAGTLLVEARWVAYAARRMSGQTTLQRVAADGRRR